MTHLTLETLARLVDEAPGPDEGEHLRSCPTCRGELEGLERQTEDLGSLPDLRPPRGDWEMLEVRLAREGLLRDGGILPGQRFLPTGWMRLAAALVLFLGGTGVGAAAMRGGTDARSVGEGLATVERARTPEEAADAVRQAEEFYIQALSRYRELSEAGEPGTSGDDPAGRYAALEGILAASRAAVREAPADPFINGILVSTLAERQATLRQISTTGDGNWF